MQDSRKMSLWAVALLALTATAWGRELVAPKKVVNGTLMLENYFNAINFTNTFHTKYSSLLAKERKFTTRGGGTVFTLTDSERFSFTNPSLGYEGLSVYYSNQFEIYTLSMMISGTNYVEGGYLVHSSDPSISTKNFITKVQFEEIDGLCAVDTATAYASDHTTNNQNNALTFHFGHYPWIKMQKLFTEGSTSSFCGFLTNSDGRTNIEWDLCNNLHYYVCQKPASRNLHNDLPSSNYNHNAFSTHKKTMASLLQMYSPRTAAKHSSGPGAGARQYTNPNDIGVASQSMFLGGISGLRITTADFIAADITYKPLDYQSYIESSNKYLKFFLDEVTWSGAVESCASDGATLYSPDHSVELDTIMAHFYPLLTPWVNSQRRYDAQLPNMNCAVLRVGYVGPALTWDSCTKLYPYICEKIIL